MTIIAIIAAAGLLVGLVLARLAARGRRIRLAEELKRAETELEWLGYIGAVLRAYPFGDGIPTVTTARTACISLQNRARARRDACQEALARAGKARV